MNVKVNYIAVGLFVIMLGTALIAGILWISAVGPHQVYDKYVVYMTESVSGLSKDGAVKYRGVDVGKIAALTLDHENPERVRVLLNIERGTPIKEDTVATLAEQGLTGLAHVSLTGGSRSSPLLRKKQDEQYPVIATKPSRFEEFGTKLSKLLSVLTDTGSQLNKLLNDTNQEKIKQSLNHLETLTGTLANQSQSLSTTLDDLAIVMNNARQASTGLPDSVAQLNRSAVALEKMASEIASAGRTLDQTISVNSRRIDRFTSETLPETTLLVKELRRIAENLHHMSRQLEADPSILLYGAPQPQPGPGE